MQDKESIQEEQYSFPYHYLTEFKNNEFSLSKYLQWGLMHASYLEFLVNEISKIPTVKLLDAGCGDGRVIFELEKKMTSCKLTGIDISERALYFARGFTKNTSFSIHDIIREPLVDLHDTCISIEVIEHIPPNDIHKYIQNIANSLTEKGIFVLTTPTTNQPTHRKHYQHFTIEMLNEYLTPYFTISEVKYLNEENYFSVLIARILANKYFILNHRGLKNFFYRLYCRKYLQANKFTGSRIYIKALKK